MRGLFWLLPLALACAQVENPPAIEELPTSSDVVISDRVAIDEFRVLNIVEIPSKHATCFVVTSTGAVTAGTVSCLRDSVP